MKKLLSLFFILSLMFSLCACGLNDSSQTAQRQSSGTEEEGTGEDGQGNADPENEQELMADIDVLTREKTIFKNGIDRTSHAMIFCTKLEITNSKR